MKRVLVVGAGFSGAVVARQLAESGLAKCHVIDSRNHIAGNCHTSRDEATGIMVHRYGPHIFHTSNEHVWTYVNRYAEFMPFVNRVKASVQRGVFSLPINLHTLNQFFGKRFSPNEARDFLTACCVPSIDEPANFEEQALKMIGSDLYETFFRGYTIKQWGCAPTELPASILKRLPVRFNYDDNYYNSRFQGIPKHGYTDLIGNILRHECIGVELETPYERDMSDTYDHTIYTGSIDSFYLKCEGNLGYRTVYWNQTLGNGDAQGNAVINYTELTEPFTRTHEHKHFAPWESHTQTLVFTEFSKETNDGDTPYYPKRLEADKKLLELYMSRADLEDTVSFVGRLATYRYQDMHMVIQDALELSEALIQAFTQGSRCPRFPQSARE